MNYLLCTCPHCQQNIEYSDDDSDRVIECPSCQGQMTLPPRPEKQSFVGMLTTRIKEARHTAANKSLLKSVLMEVVADGVLTEDEITRVHQVMAETGLTQQDIARWRFDLFGRAMRAIETDGFNSGRIAGVRSIQSFLGIHNNEIPNEDAKLRRWEYLAYIREHGPVAISVSNVVLKGDESPFWSQPAVLYEEKVVDRRYEGGSRGASIRVMKGVSFRVGAHRGHVVTDTADVSVCNGDFIITSQRLIFRGDSKSFDTKYQNILDIRNFNDGIYYTERNKQKPRKIEYAQTNGDIIMEILSRMLSQSS